MSSRPMVTVYDSALKDALIDAVPLPDVFTAPIRLDVVHYVHTLMRKNDRQAYAVYNKAGHEVRYSLHKHENCIVEYSI